MRYPKLSGNILITGNEEKIVISGDPEGLRSLSVLLAWLADQDLDTWPYLKEGQHAHLHVYPRHDISEDSREVELMRRDPKGGEDTEGRQEVKQHRPGPVRS